MRKYLKPALEMDIFDLRDVLTASDEDETLDPETGDPTDPEGASAPIVLDFN